MNNDVRELIEQARNRIHDSHMNTERLIDALVDALSASLAREEVLRKALRNTIPHLRNYLLDAEENGHPEWIATAGKALNEARGALAENTNGN